MLEGTYRTNLVKRLKKEFPGIIILHGNANQLQGISDLVLLYKSRYAMLETKMASNSSKRPNQEYYINYFKNQGAYAAFVCKSNEEEIINELGRYFKTRRATRIS
jgi:hypothetical protein